MSSAFTKNSVRILGTTPETIDLAEDRDRFRQIMEKLDIPMPESGMAINTGDAHAIASRIGYPLIDRTAGFQSLQHLDGPDCD